MHWLTTDDDLFDYCLENSGNQCTLITTLDYYAGHLEQYQNDNSCVFKGNFNILKKLKAKGYPNIWLGDEFLCSYYTKFIRNMLINKDYIEATLSDLLDNWDKYFKSTKLFVRPDAYDKVFPGLVVESKEEFKKQLDIYQVENYDISIFIAPYKKLNKEYRFVCSQQHVLTGCQYMENGELSIDPYFPKEAIMYAHQINKYVSKILPYPFYIIDVGDYLGAFGIVELNAFNTAGFYACNLEYINDRVTLEIDGVDDKKRAITKFL